MMIRKALGVCLRALPKQNRLGLFAASAYRFATNDPRNNKEDPFKNFKRERKTPQSKEEKHQETKVTEEKPKQDPVKELKTKQEQPEKKQQKVEEQIKPPKAEPEKVLKTQQPKKDDKQAHQSKISQQSTTNSKQSDKKASDNKQNPKSNQKDPKFWQKLYEKALEYIKNYKPHPLHALWFAIIYLLFPKTTYYSWQQLIQLLNERKISQVKILSLQGSSNKSKRAYFLVDDKKGSTLIPSVNDLLEILKQYPDVKVEFQSKTSFLHKLEQYGLLLTCIAMLGMILTRKNTMKAGEGLNVMDTGKKKFEMVKDVKVKFADVAGLQESKFEIQEFVDFLKFPQKYKDVGARIPKGALLTGPPGTGKTLLAKACAGEAGVPFFFTSGSDFVEMYVGLGAARVRDLFKQAKAMSPSIIFIDEIDAVGRKRHNKLGSNDERDGTLNQLLVQMDGFGTDSKVIVMAATNRKQLLDPALTRPGRFDRSIQITLPDLQGRRQIFHVHLTPLKLNPQKSKDQYARRLATLTPGFSGAEIANICNQAAILAARHGKVFVDAMDFEMSTERVLGGVERKSLMSEEERKVVAVHESGHGVVSWFLKGAHPLLKLTIIPRSKGSLGFAQYLPSQGHLQTRDQLLDRICFILAGRCAQQHFFKRITTGAYDDLQKAHQIAYVLVTKLGMSEKIGYTSFNQTQYLKEYSEATGNLIDDQIKVLIDRCTKITRQMVIKHENDIERLSQALLEKESLDGKEILRILGDRPFEPHSSYKAYLDMQKKDEEEKLKKAQEQKEQKELPEPNTGNTSS